MIAAIHSEIRKLTTIYATYIWSALALLISGFICFYGIGYKHAASFGSGSMQEAIFTAVSIAGTFIGIVAILLICHEYRYNTISYTLTISNLRLKVLVAKLIAVTLYAALMALIIVGTSALLVSLGVRAGGGVVPSQDMSVYSVLWKSLAYIVGGSWMGLVFGFLFRNMVFTIVFYFMLPTTIELALHNLLKVSSNYLPDMLQNQILGIGGPQPGVYSPLASLGMYAAYLAGIWIVAAILFIKRDAN